MSDKPAMTPLQVQCCLGDYEKAQKLISKGIDINERNLRNRTAAHYAFDRKHDNIVSLLIDNGADLEVIDDCGSTPASLYPDGDWRNRVDIHKEHNKILDAFSGIAVKAAPPRPHF